MARFKHRSDPVEAVDNMEDGFIYNITENDPLFSEEEDPVSGETPDGEEAPQTETEAESPSGSVSGEADTVKDENLHDPEPAKTVSPDPDTSGGSAAVPEVRYRPAGSEKRMADLSTDEEYTEKKRRGRRGHFSGRHPRLRTFLLGLVTFVLLLIIASFIFSGIYPDVEVLNKPQSFISRIVTPVQSLFSGVTDIFGDFFRSQKLKANIEAEYNAVVAENEQLVYKAMLADELQHTLSQYEDMADEISANANMQPIVCTVIGKSDSNYFSTFTINKGSNDGIEDYMAVTYSGALLGYTESVQATKSTVRTIIDSDASIAALIQSSRDQGTVRGTLGIDGTAMCRMYYLPDDNLPRPGDVVVTSGVGMSFPKGIPIGTVRESTRGMDANKQYIVIEPSADFRHIEYVIVLRYKPAPEAIEGRDTGRSDIEFVPLESARPSPVVPEIASSLFDSQSTPDPDQTPTPSPTPSPTPEPTPEPTLEPTPVPTVSATPEATSFEYKSVGRGSDPTPSPTPTMAPTPTPYFTPDPETMTYEED